MYPDRNSEYLWVDYGRQLLADSHGMAVEAQRILETVKDSLQEARRLMGAPEVPDFTLGAVEHILRHLKCHHGSWVPSGPCG